MGYEISAIQIGVQHVPNIGEAPVRLMNDLREIGMGDMHDQIKMISESHPWVLVPIKGLEVEQYWIRAPRQLVELLEEAATEQEMAQWSPLIEPLIQSFQKGSGGYWILIARH